jgi:hypothetical protein
VPLARDLHPEFGYVGSAPKLFRKLGLVSAFVVFGLMAGASGVALFMAGPDPDPDPMNAMALAPAEALVSTSRPSASPAEAKAIEGQETLNASVTPSWQCRDLHLGDDCTSARVRSSRPAPAMNERPAIAAVAIGHRDDPAALPPQPAVAIAAIPETPPDASAVPDSGEVPAPPRLRQRASLLRLLPIIHERAAVTSRGARDPTPGGPVTVVKPITLEVRGSGDGSGTCTRPPVRAG